MKRLNDLVNVKQALENSAWAAGVPVGTVIDTTGFGRARFIFSFGANSGTTAAISSMGTGHIWKAATSGDTFTAIDGANLAAVTSGVLGNDVMVVDVPTDSAKPWMKVSGVSVLSTAINISAVVELYQGVNRPPTSSAQQVVVV